MASEEWAWPRKQSDKDWALHAASRDGYLAGISSALWNGAALESGADQERLGARCSDWTALMLAAGHGNAAAVELLLSCGADPNARRWGWTPLLAAVIRAGDVVCVEKLLAAGAKVDESSDWGARPIEAAARRGDGACVSALAKAGADLGWTDGGGGLIRQAYDAGCDGAIKSLLELGATIGMLADGGRELMMMAVGHASAGLLVGLRAMGMGRDSPGVAESMLLASQKGWALGIKLMLDWGVDPRAALLKDRALWKSSPQMANVILEMQAIGAMLDESEAIGEASGSGGNSSSTTKRI
jgi:hypothetical protein